MSDAMEELRRAVQPVMAVIKTMSATKIVGVRSWSTPELDAVESAAMQVVAQARAEALREDDGCTENPTGKECLDRYEGRPSFWCKRCTLLAAAEALVAEVEAQEKGKQR